jgi:hypothetical protein
MDDETPVDRRRVEVVLYDSDYGFAMNIVKNLYLGPGDPGPGDEWNFPPGPADTEAGAAPRQGSAVALPAPPAPRRAGLLRRLFPRG